MLFKYMTTVINFCVFFIFGDLIVTLFGDFWGRNCYDFFYKIGHCNQNQTFTEKSIISMGQTLTCITYKHRFLKKILNFGRNFWIEQGIP